MSPNLKELEDRFGGTVAELTGVAEVLAGCSAEEGAFAELLAGCASEDAGTIAGLFAGSAADESASRISLLMASWLCGMSRYLLLDENASLLELSGVGVWGGSCGSIGLGPTSPPRGSWFSSDELLSMGTTTWPEVGEELSSQAFNVNAADKPNVAAIAFLAMEESFVRLSTFFFSIFKTKLLSPIHSV